MRQDDAAHVGPQRLGQLHLVGCGAVEAGAEGAEGLDEASVGHALDCGGKTGRRGGQTQRGGGKRERNLRGEGERRESNGRRTCVEGADARKCSAPGMVEPHDGAEVTDVEIEVQGVAGDEVTRVLAQCGLISMLDDCVAVRGAISVTGLGA